MPEGGGKGSGERRDGARLLHHRVEGLLLDVVAKADTEELDAFLPDVERLVDRRLVAALVATVDSTVVLGPAHRGAECAVLTLYADCAVLLVGLPVFAEDGRLYSIRHEEDHLADVFVVVGAPGDGARVVAVEDFERFVEAARHAGLTRPFEAGDRVAHLGAVACEGRVDRGGRLEADEAEAGERHIDGSKVPWRVDAVELKLREDEVSEVFDRVHLRLHRPRAVQHEDDVDERVAPRRGRAAGGAGGAAGDWMRRPQSEQSVPKSHSEYVEPGPPSSQALSAGKPHVLSQSSPSCRFSTAQSSHLVGIRRKGSVSRSMWGWKSRVGGAAERAPRVGYGRVRDPLELLVCRHR